MQDGVSARDYAERAGHEDVVKAIMEAYKKMNGGG